jgi:hypothetical protein
MLVFLFYLFVGLLFVCLFVCLLYACLFVCFTIYLPSPAPLKAHIRQDSQPCSGSSNGTAAASRADEVSHWPGAARGYLHVKLLQLTALLRMRLLKDAVALVSVVGDLDQPAYTTTLTLEEYEAAAADGGSEDASASASASVAGMSDDGSVVVSAVPFELRLVVAAMPHYVAGPVHAGAGARVAAGGSMGQRQEGGGVLSGSHQALNNLYALRAAVKKQQDCRAVAAAASPPPGGLVRWEVSGRMLTAAQERVSLALVNIFMANDQ